MEQVQSPIIPVVHQLMREHPGTISLGQGVVHYGPPAEAAGAFAAFEASEDRHKYKDVAGVRPLLDVIEQKLPRDNCIQLDDHTTVVVTAGGNMAFMNALFAVTDPGDQVILQTPYYFNHEMAVMMAGCEPVLAATDEQYQLDVGAIDAAITARTRAVVTISPNNPTGAVYDQAPLRRVNALCRERGVFHIHDEAYEYFTYQGAKHFSPASMAGAADHTISLFSLSKSYGFASWRIGYMVMPQRLLVAVKKAQDTVLICPPVICQYAAAAAMQVGAAYCRAHLPGLTDVRRLVLDALDEVGDFATVPKADGAFYFLLRLDTKLDAMAVVERLVRQFGVAVIPGTTFGMHDGCYLRIAYGALEKATVAEGMGRLVRGLKAVRTGR